LGREASLQAELLAQANRLVGGPAATLVIDDTALPKKGTHSVGIASQYAGARQERQLPALVSLTLALDEVPIPIVLQLFLPDSWIKDPERMHRAGVPEAVWMARSKPEIALQELQRLLQAGVSFGALVTTASARPSGRRSRRSGCGFALPDAVDQFWRHAVAFDRQRVIGVVL
jgi:SRSO17 transposase